MFDTMNCFLYAWHKRNTSFCTARQNVLIWSLPDVIISNINPPMTPSRFTARLPRTLVSRSLCCFVVCECRSSDASEVKELVTAGRRCAGLEGSEIESEVGGGDFQSGVN